MIFFILLIIKIKLYCVVIHEKKNRTYVQCYVIAAKLLQRTVGIVV